MPPSGFKRSYTNHLLAFIKGLYEHVLEEAKQKGESPEVTLEREIDQLGDHLSKFKLGQE